MKLVEVPLYDIKPRRGRPQVYDFTPFLKPSVKFVVYPNLTLDNYEVLKNSFFKWRKKHDLKGSYEYDYREGTEERPPCLTIWRTK